MNSPNYLSLKFVNKDLLLSWQPPFNIKGGPQDVSSYIVFASPVFLSGGDTCFWQKLDEVQGTIYCVPKNYWNTSSPHVIGVVAVNGLQQSAMAKVKLPFHGDDRLCQVKDSFQCHVPVKTNLLLTDDVTGHCMVEDDCYKTLSYILCAIPMDVKTINNRKIPMCKMIINISPAMSKMIETSTDSKGMRNVELHLRFCEYDLLLGHCKDRIPDCMVFVGSQRVHIQVNDKESSVHRPVDITRACALAKYNTTLSVELGPQETKKYCMFITVVKRLEMRTILQRLVKNMPSILEAKQYIQGRFQTDSSGVQSTSYKAKLCCPIGQSRLVTPCRGDRCSHILCMEAETLVRMNEGKSVKKCFICQKPYSNIVVDKLFLLILKKVPPWVTEVEFQPDGSWSYSNNATAISSLTLDEEGIHSGILEVDMSLHIENNNSCLEIQNCEILPKSIPDLNGTHIRVNTEEHKSITVGPTNPFDSRHRRASTAAVFSQECSGETQGIYCADPSYELPKEKEHIDTLNTPQCRSKPTKRSTQFEKQKSSKPSKRSTKVEKQKSSKPSRCSSRVSGQKGAKLKERDIQNISNTTIPNKLNNGSNLETNGLKCMSQGLMQPTVILGSISDKHQETVSKSEIGSIHCKNQIDILVNDSQEELNAMKTHVEEGKFVEIVLCEWDGNKETYTEMEDDKSVLNSIIVDTQLECREHGTTNKSVTNEPKQTHSQQSLNVGNQTNTHLLLLDNLISNTFTCSICKEEFGLTKVYENFDERLCIDCARKKGVLSLSLYNLINSYDGKSSLSPTFFDTIERGRSGISRMTSDKSVEEESSSALNSSSTKANKKQKCIQSINCLEVKDSLGSSTSDKSLYRTNREYGSQDVILSLNDANSTLKGSKSRNVIDLVDLKSNLESVQQTFINENIINKDRYETVENSATELPQGAKKSASIKPYARPISHSARAANLKHNKSMGIYRQSEQVRKQNKAISMKKVRESALVIEQKNAKSMEKGRENVLVTQQKQSIFMEKARQSVSDVTRPKTYASSLNTEQTASHCVFEGELSVNNSELSNLVKQAPIHDIEREPIQSNELVNSLETDLHGELLCTSVGIESNLKIARIEKDQPGNQESSKLCTSSRQFSSTEPNMEQKLVQSMEVSSSEIKAVQGIDSTLDKSLSRTISMYGSEDIEISAFDRNPTSSQRKSPEVINLVNPLQLDPTSTSELVQQTLSTENLIDKLPSEVMEKCSSCSSVTSLFIYMGYFENNVSAKRPLCTECAFKQGVLSFSLFNLLKSHGEESTLDSCRIPKTGNTVSNIQEKKTIGNINDMEESQNSVQDTVINSQCKIEDFSATKCCQITLNGNRNYVILDGPSQQKEDAVVEPTQELIQRSVSPGADTLSIIARHTKNSKLKSRSVNPSVTGHTFSGSDHAKPNSASCDIPHESSVAIQPDANDVCVETPGGKAEHGHIASNTDQKINIVRGTNPCVSELGDALARVVYSSDMSSINTQQCTSVSRKRTRSTSKHITTLGKCCRKQDTINDIKQDNVKLPQNAKKIPSFRHLGRPTRQSARAAKEMFKKPFGKHRHSAQTTQQDIEKLRDCAQVVKQKTAKSIGKARQSAWIAKQMYEKSKHIHNAQAIKQNIKKIRVSARVAKQMSAKSMGKEGQSARVTKQKHAMSIENGNECFSGFVWRVPPFDSSPDIEKTLNNCVLDDQGPLSVSNGEISDLVEPTSINDPQRERISCKEVWGNSVPDVHDELQTTRVGIEQLKMCNTTGSKAVILAPNEETDKVDKSNVQSIMLPDIQPYFTTQPGQAKPTANETKPTKSKRYPSHALLDKLISNTFRCISCAGEFSLTKMYVISDKHFCIDCALKKRVISNSLYNILNSNQVESSLPRSDDENTRSCRIRLSNKFKIQQYMTGNRLINFYDKVSYKFFAKKPKGSTSKLLTTVGKCGRKQTTVIDKDIELVDIQLSTKVATELPQQTETFASFRPFSSSTRQSAQAATQMHETSIGKERHSAQVTRLKSAKTMRIEDRLSKRVSQQKSANSMGKDSTSVSNIERQTPFNSSPHQEKTGYHCVLDVLGPLSVNNDKISDLVKQASTHGSRTGITYSKELVKKPITPVHDEIHTATSSLIEIKVCNATDRKSCELASNEVFNKDDTSFLKSVCIETIADIQPDCTDHQNKVITRGLDKLVSNIFKCSSCAGEFGLTKMYVIAFKRLCIECALKEGFLSLYLYNLLNSINLVCSVSLSDCNQTPSSRKKISRINKVKPVGKDSSKCLTSHMHDCTAQPDKKRKLSKSMKGRQLSTTEGKRSSNFDQNSRSGITGGTSTSYQNHAVHETLPSCEPLPSLEATISDFVAPSYVDLTTSEIVQQTLTGAFSEDKVHTNLRQCSSCSGEIYSTRVLSRSKNDLCIDCGYKQGLMSLSLYNSLKSQEVKTPSDSCRIQSTSSGIANVLEKKRIGNKNAKGLIRIENLVKDTPAVTEATVTAPAQTTEDMPGIDGRRKTKQKFMFGEQHGIPNESIFLQREDTTDIVTTRDLAPSTKKLMHLKEIGSVENLFVLPGCAIQSSGILKLFNRNLKTRQCKEIETDENRMELEAIEIIRKEERSVNDSEKSLTSVLNSVTESRGRAVDLSASKCCKQTLVRTTSDESLDLPELEKVAAVERSLTVHAEHGHKQERLHSNSYTPARHCKNTKLKCKTESQSMSVKTCSGSDAVEELELSHIRCVKLQNKPSSVRQQESDERCEGKGSSPLYQKSTSRRTESQIGFNSAEPLPSDQIPSMGDTESLYDVGHSSLDQINKTVETELGGINPLNSDENKTLRQNQSSNAFDVFALSVLDQSNTLVKMNGTCKNRSKVNMSATFEHPPSFEGTKMPYVSDFEDSSYVALTSDTGTTSESVKVNMSATSAHPPSLEGTKKPYVSDFEDSSYVDLKSDTGTTSESVKKTLTDGFTEIKVPKILARTRTTSEIVKKTLTDEFTENKVHKVLVKCSSCAEVIFSHVPKVLSKSKTLCIDCGLNHGLLSLSLYNRLKSPEGASQSDNAKVQDINRIGI
ncbi:uncharacterized protein LOC127860138 [Dreissena polymorpha]|uniref:SP-RING-type domain-containing protein n=1 Tax=Dreissena polymorpha TaxID=45954 RepID=A0A9D3YKJ6_DREPO|nr:uncharacterized protein LOC127860138 [Dreissena polymorpha]KAH3699868.1 hypothetical protein DPMN_074830 [Dreissena polymorpha]